MRQAAEGEQQERFEAIMDFARRWREAPIIDPRPLDQIVAYDEHGLPR